jgi:predicted nuclease with TOPRIM domain
MATLRDRIDELKDELRQRDRRIEELKAQNAKLEDLVARQNETVQDGNDHIDRWIQAFDMVLNEERSWSGAAHSSRGRNGSRNTFKVDLGSERGVLFLSMSR